MEESLSTEQKILEAANQVFIRKGYDGTRMADIAEEAGINKALLHYYFRSKENLFEKVFFQYSNKVIPNLDALIENKELNIFDKIEKFVSIYIDFLIENPNIPIFIFSEIHKNPAILLNRLKDPNSPIKMPNIHHLVWQFAEEAAKGKIKMTNPFHLLVNIVSMCIFPFIGRPMMQTVLNMSNDDFKGFMQSRKQEITRFVIDAIKI